MMLNQFSFVALQRKKSLLLQFTQYQWNDKLNKIFNLQMSKLLQAKIHSYGNNYFNHSGYLYDTVVGLMLAFNSSSENWFKILLEKMIF